MKLAAAGPRRHHGASAPSTWRWPGDGRSRRSARWLSNWWRLLGADTLVHGRFSEAMLTVRLPGSTVVREGDRLPLSLAPDSVHVFDHSSGKRL